jgi:hypothetical protein
LSRHGDGSALSPTSANTSDVDQRLRQRTPEDAWADSSVNSPGGTPYQFCGGQPRDLVALALPTVAFDR